MAVTLASVDGTWTNSPTYDAAELRRADAAMFASAGIASGLVVSVDGSDVVTVTRGQAVISGDDAVAGTGVYRAGIGSNVSGSLEARDATNARIDLVVFRQYDTDVVGSHGKFASEIEIIKGTPSATPAVPSKPSMAVELARITVPASGGGSASVNSTNRSPAIAAGSTAEAHGTVLVTVTSAISGSVNVTFPVGRFSAAPRVFVSGATFSTVWRVGGVTAETATGCTVHLCRSQNDTGSVSNFPINWWAKASS